MEILQAYYEILSTFLTLTILLKLRKWIKLKRTLAEIKRRFSITRYTQLATNKYALHSTK